MEKVEKAGPDIGRAEFSAGGGIVEADHGIRLKAWLPVNNRELQG